MLSNTKNIIFDLGGVIINLNQDLTHKAFQNIFSSNINQLTEQVDKNNWLERFELGEFSSSVFLEYFKKFNPNVSNQQLHGAWNGMLLDIPKERIALIQKLAKKYNVFLLSNTNEIHYSFIEEYVQQHFEGLDFNTIFKKVYLSYQLNLRKPNKAIFEFVLNDANLIAQETLFIDDTLEHINTAKQLGIQTYHLNLHENQTLNQIFNEY